MEFSYHAFEEIFTRGYRIAFPKEKIIIKAKTLKTPWMTKGLLKSSRRKQKLYNKFLRKRTFANEKDIKHTLNYLKKLK